MPKVFSSDGIHMSKQGVSVFIVNIKMMLRTILGIEYNAQRRRTNGDLSNTGYDGNTFVGLPNQVTSEIGLIRPGVRAAVIS